jgi:hypothetical protein
MLGRDGKSYQLVVSVAKGQGQVYTIDKFKQKGMRRDGQAVKGKGGRLVLGGLGNWRAEKMKYLILLAVAVLFPFNSAWAAGEGSNPVAKIASSSPERQKQGLDEIAAQRKEMIEGLIKNLKRPNLDPKGPDASSRIAAIKALVKARVRSTQLTNSNRKE